MEKQSNKKDRGRGWLQRLFLHERLFFTHSSFVFISPSFYFCFERCLSCLQPRGKTELQSQAAKWWKTLASRDAQRLDQELRAREKCSLFNITLFSFYVSFLHAFFLSFFISVFHRQEKLFFSQAPQPWSESSSWETGGRMEVLKRRRAQRCGSECLFVNVEG